jgi:hypothetical protein
MQPFRRTRPSDRDARTPPRESIVNFVKFVGEMDRCLARA